MISNALIEKGDEQPAARFLAERHSAKLFPELGMTKGLSAIKHAWPNDVLYIQA